MQRLRPPAAIAAGALALWLALPAYVNYDTAWSLVWGRELARGAEPNLDALSAPTPHPLGTLLGVLLAPLGAAAGNIATLLVLGSLATAAYWLWSARGRSGGDAAGLAALALVAPVTWLLGDLALTGDPLHSFAWTRDQAAVLGRARGLGALPAALPDKLAHAAGLPVLITGTAGLALLLRRRAGAGGLAAAALGASLATAIALTAAGMPVVERYLLVPLVLLSVLAAGAAVEACTSLAAWVAPAIKKASPGYPHGGREVPTPGPPGRRAVPRALAGAAVLGRPAPPPPR